MADITITIDTDNAAFEDDPSELSRILAGAAQRVSFDGQATDFALRDVNGNTVGHVDIG